MDDSPIANILGFTALASYLITLLPTILKVVFPQTKETGIPQFLLKRRRLIGIIAFLLALGHGFMMVQKRNFDFFDLKTLWIYIQGISTLLIFTVLAITSNDWSVKKLRKNWKKLHKLTYLSIFILTWHIWDKMLGHWTYLTPVSIISTMTIATLLIIRMWIENLNKQQKIESKVIPEKINK
ncbi:ferric reductase-like transmembrane domain-containing protein [Halotia branconii]|uniref:Ferric reductase-like transmembrane domain-containing protein n=1 Tax=Halotia branconii CENA392 TaxID=1539056 RepID=A0AAJ6P9F0_9CYAN|nr:ferric reductase-like transmembrane domain-containing protein [Halotia branconii]WGV25617.1 ferric reductase-like transmembrane domain-containing protein [Halotia branconii CENA392]